MSNNRRFKVNSNIKLNRLGLSEVPRTKKIILPVDGLTMVQISVFRLLPSESFARFSVGP